MKCILARQNIIPPFPPAAINSPHPGSPKADLSGEATSVGRMRAEQRQKLQLKEERRQLELMREEVIKNRIRRQTEDLVPSDFNLNV